MATKTARERLTRLKREVERELRPPPKRARRGSRAAAAAPRDLAVAIFLGALKVAAVVALPFVVCVRTCVYLYANGVAPWLAVSGSALLTMGIVALYAAWLTRRMAGGSRARLVRVSRWVALPLVIGWLGYTLLYLSRVNAKSDDIRRYYTAVHPVLRVTLATAILADPGVVVTDMRRVPEDYARMGLRENDRTLHYVQPDGWVHAVDLRTRERGELRNRSLELYFRLMGLSTLRHVGTADHLHVQLFRR